MEKTKFIELGLIGSLVAFGVFHVYSNEINTKIKENLNPIELSENLSGLDKKIDSFSEKLKIGIQEAEYLKSMSQKNKMKDIDDFKKIEKTLKTIKEVNKNWNLEKANLINQNGNNYKEFLSKSEEWSLLDKMKWVYKVGNLQNNYSSFVILEKNWKPYEERVENLIKESKSITDDFIKKNNLNEIEENLNKSHKQLNVLNDKSLALDKVINFLHSNQNIITTFKIKDTQEKDFMTNIYVAKMSVVTSSVSHLLKEQDYLHKTLQKTKEKNLTNLEEQKEWVLNVSDINQKLNNQDKIEKIQNDLSIVEKEVNPAFDKMKELEKELKEIVKSKVKLKDFDLNKIAEIYKDKIKNEIKDDLKLAQENSDNEVVNDLNELNNIANTKIDEDKTVLSELVSNLEKENTTEKTQEHTNSNSSGMNLFHYYLMYSWLNSSTTPMSTVTNNLVNNGINNTNKFTNNINPSNIGANMYTVKTADGGYSTDNIIGSKINNNIKSKSTNSYRSVSVRKISISKSSVSRPSMGRSGSMGG